MVRIERRWVGCFLGIVAASRATGLRAHPRAASARGQRDAKRRAVRAAEAAGQQTAARRVLRGVGPPVQLPFVQKRRIVQLKITIFALGRWQVCMIRRANLYYAPKVM